MEKKVSSFHRMCASFNFSFHFSCPAVHISKREHLKQDQMKVWLYMCLYTNVLCWSKYKPNESTFKKGQFTSCLSTQKTFSIISHMPKLSYCWWPLYEENKYQSFLIIQLGHWIACRSHIFNKFKERHTMYWNFIIIKQKQKLLCKKLLIFSLRKPFSLNGSANGNTIKLHSSKILYTLKQTILRNKILNLNLKISKYLKNITWRIK